MLPRELPAAILVVIHIGDAPSELPAILSRADRLPALHARDGESIENGRIYVAPPGLHMTLDGNQLRLSSGARENLQRPAIDPLFRSAAQAYGKRVIGVVLTGYLDDGAAGLLAVKEQGGRTIVEDPESAFARVMPRNAIQYAKPEHVVSANRIAGLIAELSETALPVPQPVHSDSSFENKIVELDMSKIENEDRDRPGKPSAYACPECHGVLWEIEDPGLLRFRCRVGHAYAPESLEAAQGEAVEDALWAALRGLEERASLRLRMAERARRTQNGKRAKRYEEQAQDLQKHAEVIRQLLANTPEANTLEKDSAA